ncbi:MAG TPA: hypothetical protein VFX43_09550, partial [Chitinophagaceae bacterium]|nr:hypothetical protein [Chitinophagaceae bacterium]
DRKYITCSACHKIIETMEKRDQKYHRECWLRISGDIRQGSSNANKGLAWVIYNIDHNIKFKRNNKGFGYIFNNVKHLYYPDFIMENGAYVEIKTYMSPVTNAKIEYFPHKIRVLYKEEIENEILPYATSV